MSLGWSLGRGVMYTHWVPGPCYMKALVTINPDGSDESTIVDGRFENNKADWGIHP